jgi:peptide chain release factor 3
MARGRAAGLRPQSFREGHMTPVVFGSALRHFGVEGAAPYDLAGYAPAPRKVRRR